MAFFQRRAFIGLAAAGAVAFSMVPAKAEQFINVLTGGTSGVGYLEGVLKEVFFPELLSVRTAL